MKCDNLHLIIKNDNLLLLYGVALIQRKEKDCYHDIRYGFQKLTHYENAKATDLVFSVYYDDVLESAKIATGFEEPRKIAKPNVFLHIGYRLKGLCLPSRTLALKEGLELRIEQMRHFVELYETDLVVYANNTRATYETTKDNALKELPSEMVSAVRILIEHRNFAVFQ